MKTKIMAIMAVLAMVFAGVGVFATDANDADTATVTGDLKVVLDDIYLTDEGDNSVYDYVLTLVGSADNIKYVATLDDDYEEKITIVTKEYYNAIKGFKTGMNIVIPAGTTITADMLEGLDIFTSVALSKAGDIIGGFDTQIVFPDKISKDTTYEVVDAVDAKEAIVIAVAAAVAETTAELEEYYADYSSPEEVTAAIDKAVEIVKENYKDYKSPADVEKAIAEAVEKAKKSVENNNVWMYAFAVVVVVLVALSAFTLFMKYGKKAPKAPEETQE